MPNIRTSTAAKMAASSALPTACRSGFDPDAARDRLPAPAPGAGLRFPSPNRRSGGASRRAPFPSRSSSPERVTVWRAEDIRRWIAAARPARVTGMGMSGDRLGSERRRRSRIDRSAPTRHVRRAPAVIGPAGPFFGDGGALGLMTKSRAFPGVFAWLRVRRRSNIRSL